MDSLLRQLVPMQETLKLREGIVEVLRSRLAFNLAVQNAHGSLRNDLLVLGQG